MLADESRGSNLDYLLSLNKNGLVAQQRPRSHINQRCCLDQNQFFGCGKSRRGIDRSDEQESQQSIANHVPSGAWVGVSMSPGAPAPVSAARAFACGSAGGAHASHDVGVQASSRMHSLYQFVSDLFPPSVEN